MPSCSPGVLSFCPGWLEGVFCACSRRRGGFCWVLLRLRLARRRVALLGAASVCGLPRAEGASGSAVPVRPSISSRAPLVWRPVPTRHTSRPETGSLCGMCARLAAIAAPGPVVLALRWPGSSCLAPRTCLARLSPGGTGVRLRSPAPQLRQPLRHPLGLRLAALPSSVRLGRSLAYESLLDTYLGF